MNGRLAFHLLKRLHRRAQALALADAVQAGILRQEDVESHGRALSVYRSNPETVGAMSPTRALAVLSRHRRKLSNETPHAVLGSDEFTFEDIEPGETRAGRRSDAHLREARCPEQERAKELAMVRAIRAAAEPPRASDIATMLLIAQGVPDDDAALRNLLRSIRLRRPIVTVLCETRGFERTFLDLLRRGLILPGAIERSNGYESRFETFRFEHVAAARRRVIAFAGSDHDSEGDGRKFGSAASSVYPILAVAESEERLAAKLVHSSQLNLVCGTLNGELVRRTIETVLGVPPSPGRLDGIDFRRLDLGDLAIAIRPGIGADMAADSLRRLSEACDPGDPGDGLGKASRKEGARSSDFPAVRRDTDPGSGSDIIKPEPPSETRAGPPAPRIETLAGYGEASTWALQIRDELPLWRAGKLGWEEMNTKILLSGPPGVGKTRFASALCNTLQIPLLATSVARWLEPSHLGDVLRRMRRAFAEAEAQAPCILFVDEFDSIGRRVDFAKDYADYWNSLVNCGLEMLDGSTRSDGVIIVCATNDPSALDPALLRSGRLERQIEIPLPDAEARLAILQHYLGADVEGILVSAARTAGKADLHRMLQEGMELMSERPYSDLVAAAIPSGSEVNAA
jgi:hypothetical protein